MQTSRAGSGGQDTIFRPRGLSDNKNSPSHAVVVENIKPINKGSLRAFAVSAVAGLRVHGVQIIQQSGQNAWVAMPSNEVPPKNPGEKKKYFPVIEIADKKLAGEISDAVLAAFERAAAGQLPVQANIPEINF